MGNVTNETALCNWHKSKTLKVIMVRSSVERPKRSMSLDAIFSLEGKGVVFRHFKTSRLTQSCLKKTVLLLSSFIITLHNKVCCPGGQEDGFLPCENRLLLEEAQILGTQICVCKNCLGVCQVTK